MFLSNCLHEITLLTIDIDNIGCLEQFLLLWEHFWNRISVQLNCASDLTLRHKSDIVVKKSEPWSQAQDETHLCCTPDLFLWLRARLPKVGGALQKYLVGIGAPVCSNRVEKRASCKDHNQKWPQSKMTTTKSQIFGQVEIWGNLTSAVNCEVGDSSFDAAPPPKLASQALSHKLKC